MASPQPNHNNPASSPAAEGGGVETMFASAALAASGAWTRSDIINVKGARRLTLFIDYDPAAASGAPHFIFLGTGEHVLPAAGDDSWFMLSATDGTITAAVSTGTVPAGADYTVVQVMGTSTLYAQIVKLGAATNATDEIRQALTIDVTPYRWLHFIAAEVGATGSPGTLLVKYSLSA